MPIFYIGLVLLGIFYRQLQWLPGPGRLDSTLQPPAHISGLYVLDSLLTGNWNALRNAAAHLVLPAVTLGAYSTAVLLRMTRPRCWRCSVRTTCAPPVPRVSPSPR